MQRMITINPEYAAILPKLPKEQYEQLKQSVKREGLHYPIIVTVNGEILDGHNRFAICRELGIEPRVEVRRFDDLLLEKKFVIEVNLLRRHLNDFQKAELAYPLLEVEEQLAKQRQSEAGKLFGRGKDSSGSNELKLSEGQARDIVAKKIGLSPTTFQRAIIIIDQGSNELKDKLRSGTVSIAYAYKTTLRDFRETLAKPLPPGLFDIILADPPWEYFLQLRGSPDMHYPTMKVEEIMALKIPAAKDALLFLWATNPKLEDALMVMEAWGFEYKTNMVWEKDKIGTGYYVRGQHELLLIGKRGTVPAPKEKDRPSSVLIAPRREHSRKPDEVYARIERMYPNRWYLELFARTRREGWTAWGK